MYGSLRKRIWLAAAGVLILPNAVWAAEPSPINSGDSAWMLTSTALVLMMTVPGLALKRIHL